MRRFISAVTLIAAIGFIPCQSGWAQENYPTHPIRLVVGFAAGSSGDVAARIVGHKLGELLGQTVVVENRPGASSMIATDFVARSAKDGYTLLFGTIAMTINPILMPNKAPNIERDMTPIVLVGSIPNVLVVNPSLNVKDVKELIALAKQKPDELLYGAAGLGSGPHIATELFKQMADIKMTGVLYPGSAQTAMDLISGRIQVMFAPASTVLGFIKDGRVKRSQTREHCARPSNDWRSGPARLRHRTLVRHPGACRHTKADRRQSFRSSQQSVERPGRAQTARDTRIERARRQPG